MRLRKINELLSVLQLQRYVNFAQVLGFGLSFDMMSLCHVFQSVYQWIVKPQTIIKSNELFLPGRMTFVYDMVIMHVLVHMSILLAHFFYKYFDVLSFTLRL